MAMESPVKKSSVIYSFRSPGPIDRRKNIAPPIELPSRSATLSLLDEIWQNALFRISMPCKQPSKTYDLEELCKFEDPDTKSDEEYLRHWFCKAFDLFQQFSDQCKTKLYDVNHFTVLHPLIASSKMKPDLALYNDGIPLLLIEVVSSSYYDNSIAHCIAALIFQLRYFRLYDPEITEVIGYVFPKRNKNDYVTKIQLKWFEMAFHAECTYLLQEKVMDEILCRLEKIQHLKVRFDTVKNKKIIDYFMALSKSELKYLNETVIKQDSPLEQFPSAFSILLANDQHFFKIIPDIPTQNRMERIERKISFSKLRFEHLVLPVDVLYCPSDLPIFKFERQEYQPLSETEASKCLADFVTQAVNAVKELHLFGYAHNDVRLPNFCFSKNYTLKLIDFDRVRVLNNNFSIRSNYFCLKPPLNDGSCEALDYKQLGLMIRYIIYPDLYMKEVSCLTEEPLGHLFLESLINDGIYSKNYFDDWKCTLKEQLKVSDILSARITPILPLFSSDQLN